MEQSIEREVMDKLTDDEFLAKTGGMTFEQVYRFSPEKRNLTEAERTEEESIYLVFRDMDGVLDMRERQIFNEAGHTGSIAFFLKNVRACPETVLDFCRRALQPGSPERLRRAEQLAQMKKGAA